MKFIIPSPIKPSLDKTYSISGLIDFSVVIYFSVLIPIKGKLLFCGFEASFKLYF